MRWFNEAGAMRWSLTVLAVIILSQSSVQADFIYGEPAKVPNINTQHHEGQVHVSPDGLEMYFVSGRDRLDQSSSADIWMVRRPTTGDPWSAPVRLDAPVNHSSSESAPYISADGLELYFGDPGYKGSSYLRPGGDEKGDLWVATRTTRDDPWSEPRNLGPAINSEIYQGDPCLSADGLTLYFVAGNPKKAVQTDIYVTTRHTKNDPWGPAEKLDGPVNSSDYEGAPRISADDLTLFFGRGIRADVYVSRRTTPSDPWGSPVPFEPLNSDLVERYPTYSESDSHIYFARGAHAVSAPYAWDIWQVEVIPIMDLNGDGAVDELDIHELLGYWGNTDNSLYDVAPIPFGDGVVNDRDLEVLNKHVCAEQLAKNPYPISMTSNIPNSLILSWESNSLTQMQDIYIGTDYNDVKAATPNDPSYVGRQEASSYDPGELDLDTTYYWRIDQVNTYYWRIEEGAQVESIMPCTGSVWQFTTGGIIADHYPEDLANGVDGWPALLSWVPGARILWCDVYIGEDENAVAQATPVNTDIYHGQQSADETSFTTGHLNPATTYFWRIDGVDNANPPTLWQGKVRQFTTPAFIASYYPENNAMNVSRSVIFSWESNGSGLRYDVYFGEDRSAVVDATCDSIDIYQGRQTTEETTFTPGKLKSKAEYFWRIDVVDNENSEILWKGSVWRFTTPKSR